MGSIHRKKRHILAVLLTGAVLFGQPLLSYAHQQAGGIFGGVAVSARLKEAAVTAAAPAAEDDLNLYDRAALYDFYTAADDEVFWVGNGKDRGKAAAVFAVLQDAWTHGLNPEKYHTAEIAALMAAPHLSKPELQKLELLMTDAVVRYGRDISGMRVKASSIGQKADYWRMPQDVLSILTEVALAGDPAKALESMAPQGSLYQAMRRELIRLAREQSKHDQYLPINFGGGLLHPGEQHKGVEALRVRLDVRHDPGMGPASYYDDTLAAAVMAFQKQHGLNADGIIGPATLALLNRSSRDRMEQLVANLERSRWLDRNPPERYIVVNIPSQMLWAMESGKVVHQMPVVVGQPKRQTKTFRTQITGIRFNPTWTVPPGIKVQDMLPKLQEDPYALAASGIDLYIDGQSIDPGGIDWLNMTKSDLMKVKMVQTAGDHNALGYIRVLMPNDYDIYLHDTNHREFFSMTERLLSSGCVRLAEPEKIAHFVLAKNENWSDERMKKLIAAGKTVEIPAAEKLPVYIVYQTVWLSEEGVIVYGSDVYDQDKKLIDALASSDSFNLPQIRNDSHAAAAAASTTIVASAQENQLH